MRGKLGCFLFSCLHFCFWLLLFQLVQPESPWRQRRAFRGTYCEGFSLELLRLNIGGLFLRSSAAGQSIPFYKAETKIQTLFEQCLNHV